MGGYVGPMTRSLVFTALLDADPTFGRLTTQEGSEVITEVTEAWTHSDETDLYAFVKSWVAQRDATPQMSLGGDTAPLSLLAAPPGV